MLSAKIGFVIFMTLNAFENVSGFSTSFLIPGSTSTLDRFHLFVTNDENDVDILKEKASMLRREAEELQRIIQRKRTSDEAGRYDVKNKSSENKVYTEVGSSSWIMSYRFASESYLKDEDRKLKFYNGKIKLHFTTDGYTSIIEDMNSVANDDRIKFMKLWGWDEEVSSEDNRSYISFSADVKIPKSDPNYKNTQVRFYFQARIDKDVKSGAISLNDGTVTLKKDIEPPAGFWGIFGGSGILAQFQYCGECKFSSFEAENH